MRGARRGHIPDALYRTQLWDATHDRVALLTVLLVLHRCTSATADKGTETDGAAAHETQRSTGAEIVGEQREKAVDYFRKNDILIKVPDISTGSDYNLITFNTDKPYMLNEAAKRSVRSLFQRLDCIHIENKCISSPIVVRNILASRTGVLGFSEEETVALIAEGINKNYVDLKICLDSIMTEIHGEEVITELPGGYELLKYAMHTWNILEDCGDLKRLTLLCIRIRSWQGKKVLENWRGCMSHSCHASW
nr:uncharacterized protein LOC117851049 [Setaria viridis]